MATHTRFETAVDVFRDVPPRTRWAIVVESGFVSRSQPVTGGFAVGERRRSRWETVLASNFVDAPLPAGR